MITPVCPPSYLQFYLSAPIFIFVYDAKKAPKSKNNHTVSQGEWICEKQWDRGEKQAHLEEAFRPAALPTGYREEQLQPERGADGKAQWPHPGSAQLRG